MILAAVCHDAAHPGKNNAYQVDCSTDIAAKFGAESTLEKMHIDIAHHVLARSEFLWDLQAESQHRILQRIEECILATDISHHSDHLKGLQNLIQSRKSKTEDLSNEEISVLCSAILKCSDVSNPVRPIHISDKWGSAVREEFWCQVFFFDEPLFSISFITLFPLPRGTLKRLLLERCHYPCSKGLMQSLTPCNTVSRVLWSCPFLKRSPYLRQA